MSNPSANTPSNEQTENIQGQNQPPSQTSQQQQQQESFQQSNQPSSEKYQYQQQYGSQQKWYTPSSKISIKHNFSDEVEQNINDLINVFYFGAYTCRSMEFYFDRDEVALYGMVDLNRSRADHHLNSVRKLEDYQISRGGRVVLTDIKKPERDEWGTPLESLQYFLNMKKMQVQSCIKLHDVAEKNGDEHLKDFLETEFLEPLYNTIRQTGVLISNLQRAGSGLGEYEFNKDIELNLPRILMSRKIKHGPDSSVVTQYQNYPNIPYQRYPDGHAHPHHEHYPTEHSGITSLLDKLNIHEPSDLINVLKRVF